MRHFSLFSVLTLTLAACGDGPKFWDDRPVDGQYRITISQQRNTCAKEGPGPDEKAVVDMFLRTDGLYDLSHGVWWLPLDFTVEGIDRAGGNVDHEKKWKSQDGKTTYSYAVKGTVTPDEMDLKVEFNGTNDCVEKLTLRGPSRGLLDPEALDGYYVLATTPLGYVCPGDPEAPGETWNTMATISAPALDNVWLRLADGSYANIAAPDADGNVDWQGKLNYPMGMFDLPLDATLRGHYGPADVDLVLGYKFPNQEGEAADCQVLTAYQGRKRLPTVATVDNEYRVRYTVTHDCTEDGTTKSEVSESQLRLLSQPGGRIELWDAVNHVLLLNDGGSLSADIGSVADGFTGSYRGTLAPPLLEYQAEYVLYDEAGSPVCSMSERVERGHVRYVFE